MFQSLFSWMIRSKYSVVEIPPFRNDKFQSLFSWMIFARSHRSGILARPDIRFQSLFSWMIFARRSEISNDNSGLHVSILVLLDDSLEVAMSSARSRYQDPVSILVLLDDSLEDQTPSIDTSISGGFQSLFSWMIPSKCLGGRFPIFTYLVSILVLLDVSLEVDCTLHRPNTTFSLFQSLFSWMIPSKVG